MGRPRIVRHPIRGLRVKQICVEQGITQNELSNRIGISKQNFSLMITGKANITEDTARKIVQIFPEYRFEWIMGYDDYKTPSDISISVYCRMLKELNGIVPTMYKGETIMRGLRQEMRYRLQQRLQERMIRFEAEKRRDERIRLQGYIAGINDALSDLDHIRVESPVQHEGGNRYDIP